MKPTENDNCDVCEEARYEVSLLILYLTEHFQLNFGNY